MIKHTLKALALVLSSLFVVFFVLRFIPRSPDVSSIVTNQSVWGHAFPVVLSSLSAWKEVGEDELTIVDDMIIGRTRRDLDESAEAIRSRFHGLLDRSPKGFAAIGPLFRRHGVELDVAHLGTLASTQRLEVIRLPGGFRLAARSEGLLAPDLTASVLIRELGKPEEVRLVLPSASDRTVTITEYRYQGDAIRFSTATDEPFVAGSHERLIYRAVLKVATIASALGA